MSLIEIVDFMNKNKDEIIIVDSWNECPVWYKFFHFLKNLRKENENFDCKIFELENSIKIEIIHRDEKGTVGDRNLNPEEFKITILK